MCGLANLLRVCAACPNYCECVRPAQIIASVCDLANLLRVCAACPNYCECVRPGQLIASLCGLAQIIASMCGLANLLRVCAAYPTYCEYVRPAQLIASVCGLPNLLRVCVWPAQLPVLTEIRAPSLLEQHPQYVPHRDRPGYNRIIWCQMRG